MEDSPFQMSLGDLKKAIKEFKKSTPKLTSKKSELMAFANKVGLAKKKIEQLQEERRLRRFNEDYYDDWD